MDAARTKRGTGYGTAASNHTTATVRAQDASLNMLSGDVRTVRNIATAIHVEVDEQNALLTEDTDQTDASATRMAGLHGLIASHTHESPYNLRSFCILLWPLVLLIVLVLELLINFLFH